MISLTPFGDDFTFGDDFNDLNQHLLEMISLPKKLKDKWDEDHDMLRLHSLVICRMKF